MIYHMPGQSSYEQDDPGDLLRAEDDATNAGFRASKARGSVATVGEDVADAVKAADEAE